MELSRLLWCVMMMIALLVSHGESTRRLTTYQLRRRYCLSVPKLVCSVEGTAGNEAVSGTVTFEAEFQFAPRRGRKGYHICNVRINARVNGLTPGKHGFHVHTYGDVRASDGTSTGDHFTNPAGVPIAHGYPSSPIRHWGDFGNLIADNNGVAVYNAVDTVVTIPSIIGRAVTIHAGEDKGPEFQPSGDSGSRVGVCVIGLANPDI